MPRRHDTPYPVPALLAAVAALLLVLVGCGGSGSTSGGSSEGTAAAPSAVRLGYFPNITHASALVGLERGMFAEALGDIRLEPKAFNAGPEAVEALFGGAIDATYIGPNPAINAHVQSKGKAIKIIAGATSGGAAFVVRPEINGPADLRGKKLASPQLGNTQDVALRTWLTANGLKSNTSGGGDVSILPQSNADTLTAFRSGNIDGAWVPEPWATRLVNEGGGKVLVDERSLWPGGQFVTTHLIVRTEFLEDHPDAVRRLLQGHMAATQFVNENAAEARKASNEAIAAATGRPLPEAVIDAAWPNLTFTTDPLASSLAASADHAKAAGLLTSSDLKGIHDLRLLNSLLTATGQSPFIGL